MIIKKHTLSHIKELLVDESVFSTRFSENCATCNCDSSCCMEGVYVDIKEKQTILKYQDIIKPYLRNNITHDPNRWFETEEYPDNDFPSGRTVGTIADQNGCVFLNANKQCALQIAEKEILEYNITLKPFYCTAYPVVISDNVLQIDVEMVPDKVQCCTPDKQGSKSSIDVCNYELEYVLGKTGLEELKELTQNVNNL